MASRKPKSRGRLHLRKHHVSSPATPAWFNRFALSVSVIQISDRIHLDPRRAVWLPESRTLAVADLHLGEAWVRRARGQLVPVTGGDDSLSRLKNLITEYAPARVVVLGDIVHQALSVEGVEHTVRSLALLGESGCRVELCLGNHDRHLPRQLRAWKIDLLTCDQVELPEAILFHGDRPPRLREEDTRWRIQGHEHPAMILGDGVATHAKVPCFLVGDRALILPAFSDWAGGCVFGRDPFMGASAREARFSHAIACLGKRLLRIPLVPDRTPAGR
jgi:DNA ligase-associated metallophosphoesterase